MAAQLAAYEGEYDEEADTFVDKTSYQENGLPEEWCEAKNLGDGKIWVVTILERFVFYAIALGVYWLHIKFPSGVNQEGLVASKISNISSLQLEYFYLAAFVFVHIKAIMGAKTVAYRQDCPINPPHQYVFQVVEKRAPKSFVLLAMEGTQGAFNRAQRSVANFDEYAASTVLNLVLVGYVFPFTVLIFIFLVFVGRVLQVDSYAADPEGRGLGYAIHVHVVHNLCEGLLLIIGVRALLHSLHAQ